MEAVDKPVGRDILLFIFQGNESYTQFIQLAVCLEPLVPVFELVQIFFVEAGFCQSGVYPVGRVHVKRFGRYAQRGRKPVLNVYQSFGKLV